ncbi:colicin E5-related ribonuclease [Paenibacillus hunanensis]|uniref:Peroxiredoxin n=1 Tax=Paenibacillus hunanensis TaxID=539262 RepID=A0ABU1IW93_9BACL|nr:colicin E5-related ribonuclease [Paenibacillus hunanensis]MDR6243525.1 putative peroxiredoxin [Paenibacillus hunanensis]GGI98345.1 hypothetical protein GCM10008022_03890 [Paenibacillus hunanensis]
MKKPSGLLRSLILCLLIVALITTGTYTKKAEAFAPALALGGVEAGAIMFWGGAVAVAATGTAVGLDPEAMKQIEQFGKSAWEDADELTRKAITASVNGLNQVWNGNSKYSLQWQPDASIYLTQKWNEYFGNGVLIDPNTKKITKIVSITEVIVPSYVVINPDVYPKDLGAYRNGSYYYIKNVSVDRYGKVELSTSPNLGLGDRNLIAAMGTFPNALAAYNAVKKLPQYSTTLQTVKPAFYSYNDKDQKVSYTSVNYPVSFPNVITIPAPKSGVDISGKVTQLIPPTIGKNGNTIVMGYPNVWGSVETLSPSDSITTPIVIKVKLSDKIKKQMQKRNWTEEDIEDTVKNPHATSEATNKANGKEATAYFNEDGTYVVKENETDEIIQISNRKDPDWVPDPTIKTPYYPSGRGASMPTSDEQPGTVKRGDTMYYNAEEALKLISKLKNSKSVIYGIDSVKIGANQTQPYMEHSIDFKNSKSNWDAASAFIESKANLGLMFDIVSDEEMTNTTSVPSFLDMLVYKAMLNFLDKHQTEDVKTLLDAMQLNSDGQASSEVWAEWQESLKTSK